MNILWINKITEKEIWRTTQLKLSGALRRRGHNVMLVMAKNIGENKIKNKDIIYIPAISYHLISGISFGLILLFYFPFFIRKKNLDIVIIDGTSVWLPFVLTLKLFGIPLIMDIRTLPIEKKKPMLFEICLRLSKYTVDGLSTITPELEKILRTRYNLQDKKIGIWPSGTALEDFTISDGDNILNDQTDSKRFVLIHHGSYRHVRGIENLIKSISELDDSLRNITKLLIVGVVKEDKKELIQLCNEMGVRKQIEIIPRVKYEKIPSYIQSSDIGIIPLPPNKEYWQVSVPLKTLECMAMGKPILVTSIPFHKRLFEKGKCGLLIDKNDPKTLSNAITCLYQNREKLGIMGKTGKEIVKNYYTWDIIAIKLEKFIETILADY